MFLIIFIVTRANHLKVDKISKPRDARKEKEAIIQKGNIRDENVDTVKSLDNSIPSIDLQVPFVSNTAMIDVLSGVSSSCTIITTKTIILSC